MKRARKTRSARAVRPVTSARTASRVARPPQSVLRGSLPRAGQSARAIEQRWLDLANALPDILLVVDRDGTVKFAGKSAGGRGRPGVVGRNVSDLVSPAYGARIKRAIRHVFRTGRPEEHEMPALAGRGDQTPHAVHLGPVKHGGKVVEVVLAARDIDSRKRAVAPARPLRDLERAKKALYETKERLAKVFDTMHEGFALHEIVCDDTGKPRDYRFLDVNPAFERITGLKREAVIGRTARDVLPGLDQFWVDVYGRVALTGRPVRFQRYSAELLRYYDVMAYCPQTGRFVTLMEDVTESRHTMDALRTSEEKYRRLVEGSFQGVVVLQGEEWRPVFANQAAARMSGYSVEEILRLPPPGITSIIHPSDVQGFASRYADRMKGRALSDYYEFRIICKNGSVAWLESSSTLVQYGGKPAMQVALVDVTDRRVTLDALRTSEEKYRMLVEQSLQGVMVICDVPPRLAFANVALAEMAGETLAALVGRRGDALLELIHPEDRAQFLEYYRQQIQAGGKPRRSELRLLRRDGSIRWLAVVAARVVYEGRPGLQAAIMDVTESRQAAQALRASEEMYRSLVQQSLQGVVVAQGEPPRLVFANPAMEEILGYSAQELVSLPPGHLPLLIHPEDRIIFFERFRDRLQGRPSPGRYEFRAVRKDGATVWVEIFANRIEYGGTPAVRAAFVDITVRKHSAEALRESEERFREIFGNALVGIYRTSPDGKILMANPSLVHMLGFSSFEELADRNLENEGYEPDYSRSTFKERMAKEGAVTGWESVWTRRDGAKLFVRESARAVRDKGGNVLYYEGSVEDITDRKKAEEELHRLAAAVNQAAESIVITDAKGSILYVNPCFESMTGYSSAEAIGQTPAILKSGKHGRQFYKDMWGCIASGRTWRGHFTNRKKDGTLFEEEAVISPVSDEQGRIISYVAVKRDVTQQIALEDQLRHSQKMEAIGRLAGGIAHDFTNALTMINNCAKMARDGIDPASQAAAFLDEVLNASRKVGRLTTQLLSFAQQHPSSRHRVDLNKIVQGMEDLLQRTASVGVEVVFRLAPEPMPVEVDPDQIEEVLLHMAVNGIEAMPEGGRLTIATERLQLTPDEAVQIEEGVAPDERMSGSIVRLTISDTGSGMTEEVRMRAFDPFFSTKDKSTGLGLSTAYAIVKQHEGHIGIYTNPSWGSTFSVYLPMAPLRRESDQPEPAPRIDVPRGSGTVLVAEDALLTRRVLVTILQTLGYTALEAEDGRQALDLARSHPAPIDLLVTDIVMPQMDGRKLAEEVKKARPQIRVVFTSGYPQTSLERLEKLLPEDVLIAKPFTLSVVAETVRRALGPKGA